LDRSFLRWLAVLAAVWLFLAILCWVYPAVFVRGLLAFVTGAALIAGFAWYIAAGWPWRLGRAGPAGLGRPAALFLSAWLLCLGSALVAGHSGKGGDGADNARAAPSDGATSDRGSCMYLADLQEFDVKTGGPWAFGKNGLLGDGKPIQVGGIRSPKGLSMHPPWGSDYASAHYRLGRRFALFRAVVAVNDTTEWCWSPATFTVLGDGLQLWQSGPIAHNHARSQVCTVDVSGVNVLELRVQCLNGNQGVYAVWVQPRLLERADTPDPDAPRPLFETGPREFLSDLKPLEVHAGPWPLSTHGIIGPDNNAIVVRGVRSLNGLGLHPPDQPGYASASYHLGKQAALFKAAVAINDSAKHVHSQAVFEVYGDGKRLWQSEEVGKDTPPQECSVAVSGVEVLELRVASKGSHLGLHAVWLEPRLLQTADTPDK
jgi:hypothetical protein